MLKRLSVIFGVAALSVAVASCTTVSDSNRGASKARAPAASAAVWTSPTGRFSIAYAGEGWRATQIRPGNDNTPGVDRVMLDMGPNDGDQRVACLLEERTHTAPAAVDQTLINTMTRETALMNMQRSIGAEFTLQSSSVKEMQGVTVARGSFTTPMRDSPVSVVDTINISIALGGPQVRVVIISCGAAPEATPGQIRAMTRILDTLTLR